MCYTNIYFQVRHESESVPHRDRGQEDQIRSSQKIVNKPNDCQITFM